MQFSSALKRTMCHFKNFFFPNFLLIHSAKYIFSRDMFCLYHFRAKIHGVLSSVASQNFFPFLSCTVLSSPLHSCLACLLKQTIHIIVLSSMIPLDIDINFSCIWNSFFHKRIHLHEIFQSKQSYTLYIGCLILFIFRVDYWAISHFSKPASIILIRSILFMPLS